VSGPDRLVTRLAVDPGRLSSCFRRELALFAGRAS
jgi:hypothetical protein